MPKLVVKSLDEVAEPLREFYKKADDGRFVFQADDIREHPEALSLKNALDKEKDDRRKAKEEAKQLKQQLEDLGADPDEIKSILAEHAKNKEKNLLDSGKVEELIGVRVKKLQDDHKKALDALTGERDGLHGRLSELLIDNAIKDVAVKAKVRSTAIEDVLLRGKRLWQLKDNQPVPLRDGQVVYGKDPTKPQTMDEWINDLQTAAPHLFEGSSGGGANGSSGGGSGNGSQKVFSMNAPNAIGENLAAFAKGEARLTN